MIHMKKTTLNNRGFTLMELLVAMTVFLVVIGLSSGIFLQTLKSQRTITRFSESMNNATLSLEQIAREVRTGFDFSGTGNIDSLRFRNGYGNYVAYSLIDNGINENGSIGRCERPQSTGCQITDLSDFELIVSPDVDIKNLVFYVQNDADRPPLVTVVAEVAIDQDATLTLQTSVSARILD